MDFSDRSRDFRIADTPGRRAVAGLRDTGTASRKHRIDAQSDPEQGRHEAVAWVKRLRDMRRVAEKRAPGVFIPPLPHDFVGRAEALERARCAQQACRCVSVTDAGS